MSAPLLPLLHTPRQAAQWLRQHAAVLQTDSRKIQPGDAFVAWPGAAHDARAHVLAALQRGAVACLVEAEGIEAFAFAQSQAQDLVQGRVAAYAGLKPATALIGAEFYGHPSQEMAVVAATGTNGKTSTAWWLAQALSQVAAQDGRMPGCGLVGTLGVGRFVNGQAELNYTGLTTPDPVLLQGQLRQFVTQGLQACVMEASSIGIAEHRLDGTQIRVALFTNFTQDHLDYHGSMEAYWQAKRALFDWEGLQAAVINIDDAQGAKLAQELQGGALDVWTVSCEGKPARLQAQTVHYDAQGLVFTLVEEGGESHELRTALIGQYNVSNMLGVVATLRALQVPLAQAVQACSGLLPVPGRMECLTAEGQPLVAVDYAHTPDAIEKALEALRPLAMQRGGQLWCVFGCGGDRDPAKRPLMGQAAEAGADRVVLTSDNPRSEDPKAIIAQVLCGLEQTGQVLVQPDRALAIAAAVQQAAPEDVLLVAGKGHEDYQEIHGQRTRFIDQEHVQMALDKRAQGAPMMTLAQAAQWLPQAGMVGDGTTPIQRVHTDTRTLQAGDLFVALKGERFDANDFLEQAREAGAVAAVCQPGKLAGMGWNGLEVADSTQALGQLAAGWRAQFNLPLIAVTGSNGKTTVTQMIASILHAAAGDAAFATQGNLNNDIGVPLTLLRLRAQHKLAVVELGMNHPGEIAGLAQMAAPTVALVNNAQREHQEFMGTVEAVAHENGNVIAALPADGVAVYPADETYTAIWQALAGERRSLRFALDAAAGAEVHATQIAWVGAHWEVRAATPQGPLDFTLQVAGRHNVKNALAAAACALAAGVPLDAIAHGLSDFVPVKGRSRALALHWQGRAITVVDDSYNANPDSVRAAIEVLRELPAPRLLVLGDMGEVGDQGEAFHVEIGAYAREQGIDQVLTLGSLARHAAMQHPAAQHCGDAPVDMPALLEALQPLLPQAASVLVKGSRFMQMDRVVELLLQAQEQKDNTCCPH